MTTISEENKKQVQNMRENFISLRRSKGWSIQELSEISGIDIKTLADIEEGQDFDIDYLFRLCRLYNISPHRIFFPVVIC